MATLSDINISIATLRSLGYNDDDPAVRQLLQERDALIAQANNTDTPMFDTMIAGAKFPVTNEKKQCIIETVDALYDPNLSNDEKKEPALLLGNIQCGKTDTFENIIAPVSKV